jgi:NAD(P)-dependent dehydrogenase (short-subunit alcohol dehydrogenase family)
MTQPQPHLLASRIFSYLDQEFFARLSGDANPLHMDAVAARRSVVGGVVVHGVHTLLWALEVLAQQAVRPAGLQSLDVRFPKAVYLGDEVELTLQSATDSEIRLRAAVGDRHVALIRLKTGPAIPGTQNDGGTTRPFSSRDKPEDHDFRFLQALSGTVDFAVSAQEMAAAFPHAAAFVGAARLRSLAACSRLVGMHCPGLQSVFSRLTLDCIGGDAHAPIAYRVIETDERFSIVRMQVQGAELSGRVEAFSSPKPTQQPTMADLAASITPREFSGQSALVVGGSRGLGELTAKIIAAGGGTVFVTYAVGRQDADRVVEEIRAAGGKAQSLAYDVTKPAKEQLLSLPEMVLTHIYYFATCPIFYQRANAFEPEALARFTAFYVTGLYDLCQTLSSAGTQKASVFYPSSIAVEERPKGLSEYAMAKAAGEILCADLPHLLSGFRVVTRRLPRVATDQTATVAVQAESDRAIDVLLPTYRAIQKDRYRQSDPCPGFAGSSGRGKAEGFKAEENASVTGRNNYEDP